MATASTTPNTAAFNTSVSEIIKNSVSFALKLGFTPIPLIGKCPKFKDWTKVTKDTCISVINQQFQRGSNNVGVLCGKTSGIVVVDIDNKDNGMGTWIKLIQQYGDPQTFRVMTGSRGLHYYFLYDSDTESLKSRSKAVNFDGKLVGIDIKTNGGQVVFPGSIHPDTGNQYVLCNYPGDITYPVSKMPDWLLALLLATESENKPHQEIAPRSGLIDASGKSLSGTTEDEDKEEYTENIPLAAIIELVSKLNVTRASNYDEWYRVIYAIKSASTSFFNIAKEFSKRTTRNNYDETSLKTMWDRADGSISFGSLMYWLKLDIGQEEYDKFKAKYNMKNHKKYSKFNTMLINQENEACVEYLEELMGENLVVISAKGPYFVFNVKTVLWENVELGSLAKKIKRLIIPKIQKYQMNLAQKISESKDAEFKSKNQSLVTLAGDLINKFRKWGLLQTIAESLIYEKIQPNLLKNFNTQKGHLPLKNGMVVNMKTKTVRPRTRDDYWTFELPFNYDSTKNHPVFKSFIETIMLEDRKDTKILSNFMQVLMGYGITGENVKKYLVMFYGAGDAGKSTFVRLFTEFFTIIVASASKNIIIQKQYTGGPNSELDRLRDARIVFISELAEGEVLDNDMTKRMTSGGKDKLNSRSNYQNDSEWSPHFMPVIVTNYLPKCKGDQQTLNRCLSFPFRARFCPNPNPKADNERKCDENIDKLLSSLDVYESFLAWLIEGAYQYYQSGITIPKEVQEATEEYRKNQSSIELFLEDCTEKTDDINVTIELEDLWNQYGIYCGKDLHKESKKALSAKLRSLGFKDGKHSENRRVIFYGLRLITKPISLLL